MNKQVTICRLLQNDTLETGVLLLVLMYTVPVLITLAWQL